LKLAKGVSSVQVAEEAKAFLEKTRIFVDRRLSRYVPRETAVPVIIHKAMRYSLFAGGKRLRPALTLAAAFAARSGKISGKTFLFRQVEDAVPAACALEMIHTYSLIHDDLPAMDDDDLRRGRPTCHKVFGEAMAILAGDALLTQAFETLAAAPRRTAELVRAVAKGAGTLGMVGGQVLDLEAEGKKADLATVQAIHLRKTAALILASCEAGALAVGAGAARRAAIVKFGKNIGLAFQVVDDILDVTSSSEVMGKTAGKDVKAGKATYPAVMGLEKARKTAERLTETALNALRPLGERAHFLEVLGRFVVERTS
jgi:geranylgeranyl diphosphate synthase type II